MEASEVLLLRKGGQKTFSHPEVGHKSFEVVSTRELKVLAILKRGAQNVPTI